jgi:hypothetical protein
VRVSDAEVGSPQKRTNLPVAESGSLRSGAILGGPCKFGSFNLGSSLVRRADKNPDQREHLL